MSETAGWADFMAARHEAESPAARMARQARQAEERADRQAEQDEAERRQGIEDRREAVRLAALTMGLAGRTSAEVVELAQRDADDDDRYQAALRVIERVEKRREASRQQAIDRARRVRELTDAVSRSVPTVTGGPDLLGPAKAAHREYVQASRAAWDRVQAGSGGRRPFARGGVAVRSDIDHEMCPECAKVGASAEESVLIHHDPDLGREPVAAVPAAATHCGGCGYLLKFCSCSGAAGRAGDRELGIAYR